MIVDDDEDDDVIQIDHFEKKYLLKNILKWSCDYFIIIL